MKTDREQIEKEYHDFWLNLIQKALDKSSFSLLCTLLRPGSMHDAGWDVLDESQATFDDFNWILGKTHAERGILSARRFALHYYCFLIEMTPIHEIILNILRCASGEKYMPFPFTHLYRKKPKGKLGSIPPSMPRKIAEVINLAQKLGENKLIEHLKFVFDEALRNAIAHSDYVLTEKEFRTHGNGSPANSIPISELDRKVNFAFVFLSGLLKACNSMKFILRGSKRFHKWDNYEVLELLADENGVFGFHVHFSNGNRSTFTRNKDGVTQINMRTRDGVGFMVGLINNLEPAWKINGKPVPDWNAIENELAYSPKVQP